MCGASTGTGFETLVVVVKDDWERKRGCVFDVERSSQEQLVFSAKSIVTEYVIAIISPKVVMEAIDDVLGLLLTRTESELGTNVCAFDPARGWRPWSAHPLTIGDIVCAVNAIAVDW